MIVAWTMLNEYGETIEGQGSPIPSELANAWVTAMNEKYGHMSHCAKSVSLDTGISLGGIRRIREVVGEDFCIGKNTTTVFRKYVEMGDPMHEDVVSYAKSFVAIAALYDM